MSTINTNPINVNYPVPGVNNNSQGFRDNFASIVTNLDIAATELTDLQNKVVVKQALTGTVVNNDMANTLISNASTRSFRATTYNLGNALAGTVLVDASLADVHYGTVAANTTINFGSWPPTGTQSNIQVRLSIAPNTSPVITFSGNLVTSNNTGATTLENYSANGGLVTVTAPYGVSEMDYIISTTDCGNTLYIEPINRPRQSTQIQQRTPTPTGYQGDVAGDVAVDANYAYICTASYDSSATTKSIAPTGNTVATGNVINFNTTHGLVDPTNLNIPIIFSGNAFTANAFGGLTEGEIYYVKTIPSSTSITVSASRTSGTAGSPVALTSASPAANTTLSGTYYIGSDIWKRIALTSW